MATEHIETEEWLAAHRPEATPEDIARWAANPANFRTVVEHHEAAIRVILEACAKAGA